MSWFWELVLGVGSGNWVWEEPVVLFVIRRFNQYPLNVLSPEDGQRNVY